MERMPEEVEYCKSVVKKRFNKPLVMSENDELCFKLDTCIMQTMLPQAMVVYEVSWHLTWILPLQRLTGLVFNINSF